MRGWAGWDKMGQDTLPEMPYITLTKGDCVWDTLFGPTCWISAQISKGRQDRTRQDVLPELPFTSMRPEILYLAPHELPGPRYQSAWPNLNSCQQGGGDGTGQDAFPEVACTLKNIFDEPTSVSGEENAMQVSSHPWWWAAQKGKPCGCGTNNTIVMIELLCQFCLQTCWLTLMKYFKLFWQKSILFYPIYYLYFWCDIQYPFMFFLLLFWHTSCFLKKLSPFSSVKSAIKKITARWFFSLCTISQTAVSVIVMSNWNSCSF